MSVGTEANGTSRRTRLCPVNQADDEFGSRWNKWLARAEFPHYQQSYEHALLRWQSGWSGDFVEIEEDGQILAGALVLTKTVRWSPWSVASISCGPWWLPGQRHLAEVILQSLRQSGSCRKAIFCRYNLPCETGDFDALPRWSIKDQRVLPHVWSYWNPPRPVAVMNIEGSLDDVLGRMHRKARYSLRRGSGADVRVRTGNAGDLPAVLSMMRSLADRKGVAVQKEEYFRNLLRVYPADRLALIMGEDNEGVAAFNIAISLGTTAWLLYSGKVTAGARTFPMEVVELATIEWARRQGCTRYDLGGTCTKWPPSQSDKGYGVWHHKKRLGACAVLLAPYCDLVFHPALYHVAHLVENAGLPLLLESGLGKVIVPYERLTERSPKIGRSTGKDPLCS